MAGKALPSIPRSLNSEDIVIDTRTVDTINVQVLISKITGEQDKVTDILEDILRGERTKHVSYVSDPHGTSVF